MDQQSTNDSTKFVPIPAYTKRTNRSQEYDVKNQNFTNTLLKKLLDTNYKTLKKSRLGNILGIGNNKDNEELLPWEKDNWNDLSRRELLRLEREVREKRYLDGERQREEERRKLNDADKQVAALQEVKDYKKFTESNLLTKTLAQSPLLPSLFQLKNMLGFGIESSVEMAGETLVGKIKLNQNEIDAINMHTRNDSLRQQLAHLKEIKKNLSLGAKFSNQDALFYLQQTENNTIEGNKNRIPYYDEIKQYVNNQRQLDKQISDIEEQLNSFESVGLENFYNKEIVPKHRDDDVEIFKNFVNINSLGQDFRLVDTEEVSASQVHYNPAQVKQVLDENSQYLALRYGLELPIKDGYVLNGNYYYNENTGERVSKQEATGAYVFQPGYFKFRKQLLEQTNLLDFSNYVLSKEFENKELQNEYITNREHLAEVKDYWNVGQGYRLNVQAHANDAVYNPYYWIYEAPLAIGSTLSSTDLAIGTLIEYGGFGLGALLTAAGMPAAGIFVPMLASILATPFEVLGAYDENYGEAGMRGFDSFKSSLLDTLNVSEGYKQALIEDLKDRSRAFYKQAGFTDELIKDHVDGANGDENVMKDYFIGLTQKFQIDNVNYKNNNIFSGRSSEINGSIENQRTIFSPIADPILEKALLTSGAGLLALFDADNARTMMELPFQKALELYPIKWAREYIGMAVDKGANRILKRSLKNRLSTDADGRVIARTANSPSPSSLGPRSTQNGTYVNGFKNKTFTEALSSGYEKGVAVGDAIGLGFAGHTITGTVAAIVNGGIHIGSQLLPTKLKALYKGLETAAVKKYQGAIDYFFKDKTAAKAVGRYIGYTVRRGLGSALSEGAEEAAQYINSTKDFAHIYGWEGMSLSEMIINDLSVGGEIANTYLALLGIGDSPYLNDEEYWANWRGGFALGGGHTTLLQFPGSVQHAYHQYKAEDLIISSGVMNREIDKKDRAALMTFATQAMNGKSASVLEALDRLQRVDSRRENPFFNQIDYEERKKDARRVAALTNNDRVRKILEAKGIVYNTDRYAVAIADLASLQRRRQDNADQLKGISTEIEQIYNSKEFQDAINEKVDGLESDMIAQIELLRTRRKAGELAVKKEVEEMKKDNLSYDFESSEVKSHLQQVRLDAEDIAEKEAIQNYRQNQANLTSLVTRAKALLLVKGQTNVINDFFSFLDDKFNIKIVRQDAKPIQNSIESLIKQIKKDFEKVFNGRIKENSSDEELLNFLNNYNEHISVQEENLVALEVANAIGLANAAVLTSYIQMFENDIEEDRNTGEIKYTGKDNTKDYYRRRIDSILQAKLDNEYIDRAVAELAKGDIASWMIDDFQKELAKKLIDKIKEMQKQKEASAKESIGELPVKTQQKTSTKWKASEQRRKKVFAENKKKFEERRAKAKKSFLKNKNKINKHFRGSLHSGLPFMDSVLRLANNILYAAKYGSYKFSEYFDDIKEALGDIDINDYVDVIKKLYTKFYAKQSFNNLTILLNLSDPDEVLNFQPNQKTTAPVQLGLPKEEDGINKTLSSHYDVFAVKDGKMQIYHNEAAITKFNADNRNNKDYLDAKIAELKEANTSDESFKNALNKYVSNSEVFPVDEFVKYRNTEGIEEAIVRKWRMFSPGQYIEGGIKVRDAVIKILQGREDEINPEEYPALLQDFIQQIRSVKEYIDGLGLKLIPSEDYYYGTTEVGGNVSAQVDILLQDDKGFVYAIDIRSGYTSIYGRYDKKSSQTPLTIRLQMENSAKSIKDALLANNGITVKQIYMLPVIYSESDGTMQVEYNSENKPLSIIYNGLNVVTGELSELEQRVLNLIDKINQEVDDYNSIVDEANKYGVQRIKVSHFKANKYNTADEYQNYFDLLSITYEQIVSDRQKLEDIIKDNIDLENSIFVETRKDFDQDIPINVQVAYQRLVDLCKELDIALQFIPSVKATTNEEKQNIKVVCSLLFDAQKALDWFLQEPNSAGLNIQEEEGLIARTIEHLVENDENFGQLTNFVRKWWVTDFANGAISNTQEYRENVGLQQIAFMNAINSWVDTLRNNVMNNLANRPKLQQFYSNLLNVYLNALLNNATNIISSITDINNKNLLLRSIQKGRNLIDDFNKLYDVFPNETYEAPLTPLDAARMMSVKWNDLYGPSTAHSPSITEMSNSSIYYWMSRHITDDYITQKLPGEDPNDHRSRFVLYEDNGIVKLQMSVWSNEQNAWKNINLGFFTDLSKLHDQSQENIERCAHMNRANVAFVDKVKALLELQKQHPEKTIVFRVFTNDGKIRYDGDFRNASEFLFENEENKHDLFTILLDKQSGVGICKHFIDNINNKTFYSVVGGDDLTVIIGNFDETYAKQKLKVKSGTIIYFYKTGNNNTIGIPFVRKWIGNDAAKIVNLIERYMNGEEMVDGFNIADLLSMRLYINKPGRYLSQYNDQSHLVTINKQERTVNIGGVSYSIQDKNKLISVIAALDNVTDAEMMNLFLSSSNNQVFLHAKNLFLDGRNTVELPNGIVFTKDDFFKENQNNQRGTTWLGYMLRNNMLMHQAYGDSWKQLNIDDLDLVDKDELKNINPSQKPTTKGREESMKELRSSRISMFDSNLFKITPIEEIDFSRTQAQWATLRQRAIDYLLKVTGTDKSNIKFYEENEKFVARIDDSHVAVGAVSSSLVELSMYAPETAIFHEAFHKVIELLMTDKERNKLYELYRKNNVDAITDRDIAEGLADLFAELTEGYLSIKDASWYKKLSIFNHILFGIGMVSKYGIKNTYKLWTTMKAANRGKYAARTISEEKKNRFENLFGKLFYTVKNTQTKQEAELLHIANSNELGSMVRALSFYILESKGASKFNPNPSPFLINDRTPNLLNALDYNDKTIMENLCGIGKPNEELTDIDLAFREILEPKKVKDSDGNEYIAYPKFAAIADKVALYIEGILSVKEGKINDDTVEVEDDGSENKELQNMNIDKYDRPAYEFRKLDSVSRKVKLFFSTIPYTKLNENNTPVYDFEYNMYHTPEYMPLNQVFNTIINDCHTARSINDLYKMFKDRAKSGNLMYKMVAAKFHQLLYGTSHTGPIYKYDSSGNLISIDYEREAFANQILGAIRSQKIDYTFASSSTDKDGNKLINIKKTGLDRDQKTYSRQWTNLMLSGVVPIFKRTTDQDGNIVLLDPQANKNKQDLFHKTAQMFSDLMSQLQLNNNSITINNKEFNVSSSQDISRLKDEIIIQLHKIGIMFSKEALNYMLETKYGKSDTLAIIRWLIGDKPSFNIDVNEDTKKIGISTFIGILNSFISEDGVVDQKAVKTGYSKNGFVNNLATWQGIYQHISVDQSALAFDGKKLYSISQNSTISHIIDALNTHDLNNETIKTLMNFSWNVLNGQVIQGSIILKAILEGRAQTLKGHTYIGFRSDNRGDFGTKYLDTPTIEDYMAKLTMLLDGNLIFPTLADKSTWMYISGVTIPGMKFFDDITPSGLSFMNVTNAPKPKYIDGQWYLIPSESVTSLMLEYARTERAAIQECMEDLGYDYIDGYEKTGKKPIPKEAKIKNYHTPNKDKTSGKTIEPNGTRFLGLTAICVYENGKVVKYNLNDPNKSSLDLLKLANEKLFSKPLEEQLQIMGLTLAIQNKNEINSAIDLGIISRRNIDAKWVNKQGVQVEQHISSKTETFDNLENKQLNNLQINALAAYYMRTMDNTYGGKWNASENRDEQEFKWQVARSFAISAILGDATNRSIICSQEVQRCFSGHPGAFKVTYDVANGKIKDSAYDIQKRIGGMISTGEDNVIGLPGIPEYYTCAEANDYEVTSQSNISKNVEQMFVDSLIREMFALKTNRWEDAYEKSIDDLLNDETISDYVKDALTKAKENGVKYANTLLHDINVADGAAYITDQMCENLLRMRGAYDDKVKDAFDILRGDKTKYNWMQKKKAFDVVYNAVNIVTTKYTAYGFREHSVNGKSFSNMAVPYYNKFALFPLFPCIATGKMQYIYDSMKLLNVDMLLMTSAVKVGSQGAVDAISDNTRTNNDPANENNFIDGDVGQQNWKPALKFNTYRQHFAYLRRQLNTDPEEGSIITMGTLMIKIGLLNLRLNRTNYIDAVTGNKITGKLILDKFMGAINALSLNGVDEIKDMFCNENGVVDQVKLHDYLQAELTSRDANRSILDAIELEQDPITGETRMKSPLGATTDASWIESILISTVNKKIIDITTPGSSFVQRSVFAIEGEEGEGTILNDSNMPNNINNGEKLLMINEDHSMDAVISIDFFEDILPEGLSFEEAKKWLISQGIIGKNAKANTVAYRIPTQAQSSIHAIRFVDVVPAVKSTIILPEEFTKITGSDFKLLKSLNFFNCWKPLTYRRGQSAAKTLQYYVCRVRFND